MQHGAAATGALKPALGVISAGGDAAVLPDAEAIISSPVKDAGAAGPPAKDPNVAQKAGKWGLLRRSCAENVLPRHRPAMPSLQEFDVNPHGAVIITPDPSVQGMLYNGSSDVAQHLPMNGETFEWDSPLCSGRQMIQIRNLPSTNSSVFDGKKRVWHVAVQAKFKRRVRAGSYCIGEEFNVPISGTGVEWILEYILRACAKVFSRTTIVEAHGEQPYFLNPVLASCQLINVSKDGEQPDIWNATEDCRLLSPHLADESGKPIPAEKRRKWCDDPANVKDLWFEPEYVFTFQCWQHMIDLGNYKLNIAGFMSIDLTQFLSSQPLQLMSKDDDTGEYAYSLLVWHERLLYPDACKKGRPPRGRPAAAVAAAAAAAARREDAAAPADDDDRASTASSSGSSVLERVRGIGRLWS